MWLLGMPSTKDMENRVVGLLTKIAECDDIMLKFSTNKINKYTAQNHESTTKLFA